VSERLQSLWRIPLPIRYLIVGAWNTAFGYGCYALFTVLLTRVYDHGYIIASVLGNLVSISVAFLGYKWIVFRTKGNYLHEWLRCMAVYSTTILLSAAALPFLVAMLHGMFQLHRGAPYVAGAIVTAVTAVISFFGHKHISFRWNQRAEEKEHIA